MKKIILLLLVVMNFVLAEEITGRPDQRPLSEKSIVKFIRGFGSGHYGIDWSCYVDTPVMAAGDGEIVWSRYTNGYGNMIKIKHNWVKNGRAYTAYTIYGHLAEFKKLKGQMVYKGELIALSGSNGRSDGPHLHYQVNNENDHPIWNGTFQSEKLQEGK